jgi:hypothetical protein
LIETKRCGWICLPEISCLERESVKIKKRMESNITYIKENLPEKIGKLHAIQRIRPINASAAS